MDVERLRVSAASDQLKASLRVNKSDHERVAGTHPSNWNERDKMIAWLAVNAIAAFLNDGTI